MIDYSFEDYKRAAAYYGRAGIEGGPADGASPEGRRAPGRPQRADIEDGPADGASPEEDPDMASKQERRRRRAERRERVGDVWRELGFEVGVGPLKIEKEPGQRGRGRGRGRGRAPSGVTVTPQIPPAVWIGAAALGVVLLSQRGSR